MITIKIAKNFKDKLIGLMFKKHIDYGLLLLNVKSIHTFFMLDAIDVIGLDENFIVVEKHFNIIPNKILFLKKSTHTLELPKYYSKNYKIGEKVNITN